MYGSDCHLSLSPALTFSLSLHLYLSLSLLSLLVSLPLSLFLSLTLSLSISISVSLSSVSLSLSLSLFLSLTLSAANRLYTASLSALFRCIAQFRLFVWLLCLMWAISDRIGVKMATTEGGFYSFIYKLKCSGSQIICEPVITRMRRKRDLNYGFLRSNEV